MSKTDDIVNVQKAPGTLKRCASKQTLDFTTNTRLIEDKWPSLLRTLRKSKQRLLMSLCHPISIFTTRATHVCPIKNSRVSNINSSPVLAVCLNCEQCKQRKTKSDRQVPCPACKIAGTKCATVQRARRPPGKACSVRRVRNGY